MKSTARTMFIATLSCQDAIAHAKLEEGELVEGARKGDSRIDDGRVRFCEDGSVEWWNGAWGPDCGHRQVLPASTERAAAFKKEVQARRDWREKLAQSFDYGRSVDEMEKDGWEVPRGEVYANVIEMWVLLVGRCEKEAHRFYTPPTISIPRTEEDLRKVASDITSLPETCAARKFFGRAAMDFLRRSPAWGEFERAELAKL